MKQPISGLKVQWDGNQFSVTLPVLRKLRKGDVFSVQAAPKTISVVRIREAGTDQWLVGFETPLTSHRFIGLKPDTEYEFELRYKNAVGEGPPAFARARTNPDGSANPSFVHDLDGLH